MLLTKRRCETEQRRAGAFCCKECQQQLRCVQRPPCHVQQVKSYEWDSAYQLQWLEVENGSGLSTASYGRSKVNAVVSIELCRTLCKCHSGSGDIKLV